MGPSLERWSEALSEAGKFSTWAHNKSFAHTLRLVATGAGSSLPAICSLHRDYQRLSRFTNNPKICPQGLSTAACKGTCKMLLEQVPTGDLLIISDTTDLKWSHPSVEKNLTKTGYTTSNGTKAVGSGLLFHTALCFSPVDSYVHGIVEQFKITRNSNDVGKRINKKKVDYEDKESYKWQCVTETCFERLHEVKEKLVFVHDRESDVYEYMAYLIRNNLRFVIRGEQNRKVKSGGFLMDQFKDKLIDGLGSIVVEQKGGRPSRTAQLEFRANQVTLLAPSRLKDVEQELTVNMLSIKEVGAPVGVTPMEWTLLTSEALVTAENLQKVAYYYACRWVIEEFHKCWKTSGSDVESLRLEKVENLERMSVTMAHAAVKIMQIRDTLLMSDLLRRKPDMIGITNEAKNEDTSCEGVVPEIGLKLLWIKYEPGKPFPKCPPSRRWLLNALARLGGWMDTRRTGRPAYSTLWKGWVRLQIMIETTVLLGSMDSGPKDLMK